MGDYLNKSGSFEPNYDALNKALDESHEERIKKIEDDDKKETLRYWKTMLISIIALVLSIFSVGLQCLQGKQTQEVKIIRDTVQIIEPLDLTKKDKTKNSEKISYNDSINTAKTLNTPKTKSNPIFKVTTH